MDTEPPTHTPVSRPEPASGPDPIPGPDALPPVVRPSPGFFMQLFFIPLIIVAIIVIVWVMFSWLAHLGTQPEELARDLEKMNHSSWQKALTLANLLRDPRNDELRNDSALAQRLAEALDRQLDEGSMEQHHLWLRIYLCRALGEFQVTDGAGTLARAASTERELAELDVRRAALQAVALLTERVDPAELRAQQELMDAIRQAAQQQGGAPDELEARGQLRSTAAYVLGLIGGQQAVDQLVTLLGDPFPNTRYNAATGLARHGDPRAIPRLLEMLDPSSEGVVQYEQQPSDQGWKRELVMISALRASQLLAEINPQADLTALREAIEELLKADVGSAVNVQATNALRTLKERPSAVSS